MESEIQIPAFCTANSTAHFQIPEVDWYPQVIPLPPAERQKTSDYDYSVGQSAHRFLTYPREPAVDHRWRPHNAGECCRSCQIQWGPHPLAATISSFSDDNRVLEKENRSLASQRYAAHPPPYRVDEHEADAARLSRDPSRSASKPEVATSTELIMNSSRDKLVDACKN